MPLLGALADGLRVRALCVLENQKLTVGEVARVFQVPQSTMSRHLKVLADSGWLRRREVGTATFYELVLDELDTSARSVWVAVRSALDRTGETAEDARRLKDVLAERKLDSQAFFGRVVGEWDAVRGRLFGAGFTHQALLRLLPAHWAVADLGCGTGNVSELLAPCVESVVAVDASEPMLKAAGKRLEGARNVRFAVGSLEALPLDSGSVDAAVCVLVLHHMRNPVPALREMRRVLRTDRGGGVALVVEMVEHGREDYRSQMGHIHLGFAPGEMRRMMREAGFGEATAEPLPVDTEAKGPGLFVAVGRLE
ncbi:MAG: metalloregulator ArsR/SmtB family transcription factor [Phycisphaerales bacterium]